MDENTYTHCKQGIRLKDLGGKDFILFRLHWRIAKGQDKLDNWYLEYLIKYNFPFALCAFQTDEQWLVAGPPTITELLNQTLLNSVEWEKITISETE
jgi:hypothetical protein